LTAFRLFGSRGRNGHPDELKVWKADADVCKYFCSLKPAFAG
jgi:hypothetical protein